MEIKLEHIGRRFNREWIFRGIDYTFEEGKTYAVLGPNGSGKSTLLQIVSGNLSPSEGKVTYWNTSNSIDTDSVYSHISMAAPYMELIEEFTLSELLDFHFGFKRYLNQLSKDTVIDLLGFEKSRNKAVKYFSSGMKQRTKLALAFCSDTPVLLLDEPASNLDSQGVNWYNTLIEDFTKGRTLIVCSNQEYEYACCERHIHISNYKNP
ncbi:ABC transporter ATP-binding protein [Arcticibacter tournemirensis]|uniref:ABC transporter ATP-binding protein n=1 Tax=Arcticibacter tournemirensis TaxID=699437 RepID=A0A4Q0MEU2_9SPHI|nr:ABC transporter ATP-binding protein [Arcticibacter tournemirensis]RXF71784.1 ABC transporter ATP-binding protein [Arcticibacter tournemirensis]